MNWILNNRFIRSRFIYACMGTMVVVAALIVWLRSRSRAEQNG